jgi:hypothetical protein
VKQIELLKKLLLNNKGGSGRLWSALLALCIGTTLLLLSVMIWWNFNEMLSGKHDNDSLGSSFLTISKKITNENMGHSQTTLFTPTEVEQMRKAPQVQDAEGLIPNRFPVYAMMSSTLNFATEMFLEAVPDRFMDNKPADWNWTPGTPQVPIIISNDFLNLYNYGFALSQGLPQLSPSSIQSIAFDLKVGPEGNSQVYKAHVVGFSDRISSVLVPQSFIDHCNQTYAPGAATAPSRLIVKVKDPSDDAFIKYLQEHNYTTNAEQLRWNKLRSIVEVVTSATGLLAVLLMGIGCLVFILFIELTIARAQQSLTLLLQIGYSPKYLSGFMIKRFLPLLSGTLIVSMIIAIVVQLVAANKAKNINLNLPQLPGAPVWIAFGISIVFLLVLVRRAIRRAIK